MLEEKDKIDSRIIYSESESINELAAALAKAQGEFAPAKFDMANPFFGNRYASLTSIWASVRVPLSKNSLSVIQTPIFQDSKWVLRTKLMHSSGQWINGEMPLFMTKQDMQQLGSAITYGKRYGLSGILGVVSDEDDDGNHASDVKSKPNKNGIENFAKDFTKTKKKELTNEQIKYRPLDNKPTKEQLLRLSKLAEKNDWDIKDLAKVMNEKFGKLTSSELTYEEYLELYDSVSFKKIIEDEKFDFENK